MGGIKIKLLRKRIIKYLFDSIIIAIFIVSLVHIIDRREDSIKQEELRESIIENVDIEMNDSVEVRDINHDELHKMNDEYVGWITIEKTNIDFPIVKAMDNEYYLDHNFKKEKSSYGSIYLDYRNSTKFIDNQSAIYGHAVNYKAMFGELNKYVDEQFLDYHPIITIYTEDETYFFEIFSVRIVNADIVTLSIPGNKNNISKLINEYKSDSIYPIDIDTNGATNILSLVTCNYDKYQNGRIIVHAFIRRTN